MEGEEISISNLQEITLYSLTHPWPFKVTTLTGKAVLILLLIWGFGIIWYVGNYRNLIPGLEYGSAKFAELKQVNEKLEDIDDSMNKILSQNIRMSINTRKTGLNNNVTQRRTIRNNITGALKPVAATGIELRYLRS